MVLRLCCFLILVLNTVCAFGQYSDSTRYYLNYSFTGSINKTQDGSSNLLNNSLKLGMKEKRVSLNFANTYIYGKQNHLKSNNDFASSFDVNIYANIKHFYYWGLATYNSSYSLKINNQWMAGGGIAYSVVDREKAYLNLSDGLLIDHSDLTLDNGINDKYETLRNSFRINYQFEINRFMFIKGSNFIQNSLSRRSDYLLKTTNSLNLKINKWLNLTSQVDYNKVNRNKRDNFLLSYGLTFERYF